MLRNGVSGSEKLARLLPQAWPVWDLPRNLLAVVLGVELTTFGLVAASTAAEAADLPRQTPVLLLLIGLGLLHTELVLHVERVRHRLAEPHHTDLSSVWLFAGALLLPTPLCALVVVVLQTHMWLRLERPKTPYFKHLFNTCTLVLATIAAHAVASRFSTVDLGTGWVELPVVVLALLVFTTVNSGLVGGAIALATGRTEVNDVLGDWDDNALEVATLCLGALVAGVVAVRSPAVLLVLPPLLVLHRSVLVRQLQEKASTDGKTGLLNAAAWHTQAEKELRRARRREVPRGVLVVDLDHFKQVNDRHGHLAGDRVLAAVAGALRTEVRERDLVGRFGGEEFVVLLAGAPAGDGGTAELTAVAERIRLRIAALRVEIPTPDGPLTVAGLSASVGAAFFPDHGTELRELLQVADTALYAAKRAGRNAVRAGVQAPPPPVPVDSTELR